MKNENGELFAFEISALRDLENRGLGVGETVVPERRRRGIEQHQVQPRLSGRLQATQQLL